MRGHHIAISSQLLAVAGFSAVVLAAGCASSSGSSSGTNAGGGQTVGVRTVSGSQVLVDSSGHSLYFSDQEKVAHKVLCRSSNCELIWRPVTVPAGQQPTGPGSIAGKLATTPRGGGDRQVTFNGEPLYTFRFDDSAGQLKGNGQHDSFDGTDFTWHAATVSSAAGGSANPSSGGGYGGY